MRNIAIIPARSGSKGVKDKNIRDLCGKPLLTYSIEAAKASKIFDCVHVSTDSEDYANIARKYGADVPFLRDEVYASDAAGTWDTVKYVLEKYTEQGVHFDVVTVLQPTSPLRTGEDIVAAHQLFCEKQAAAVVSVCKMEHSPLWSNVLGKDLSLNKFIAKENMKRRQELPIYYRLNGAIYILRTEFIDNIDELYGENSYAHIMEQDKSVDIDSEMDFLIAECMIHNRKG